MIPGFFGEAAPSTKNPVGAARTPEGAEGAIKDSTPTEQHRASGQRPKTQKRLKKDSELIVQITPDLPLVVCVLLQTSTHLEEHNQVYSYCC